MTVTIDGTNGITTPSPVVVQGSTSGSITLAAPATGGTNTQTLVDTTGTLAPIVLGTSVAYTSFTTTTYNDFLNIPSWVRRITVTFTGISTSATTSSFIIQIGSSSMTTSGYVSAVGAITAASNAGYGATTAGFNIGGQVAATDTLSGTMTLINISGNIWICNGITYRTGNIAVLYSSSTPLTLSGVLDRVRLTTVTADTFDAGSANIMYE